MMTESPMVNDCPRTAVPSLPMNQGLVTKRLTQEDQQEVLKFLSERPLHTVVMAGLIRDNGMESKGSAKKGSLMHSTSARCRGDD
jgi:hypothetical protein